MKANIKISQFSRFLLKSEYPIQVKIWKRLKLLKSVPFIKKPLVNQVCIWIWSFWLTFTVLQWMKKNSKNSQFSSFLLMSRYAILVKIWKWLKLLNSVPFIRKRLLNHFYVRIWSSSLTFTVSQGMKANIKISQFSRFLLRSEYPIQVKIWKWQSDTDVCLHFLWNCESQSGWSNLNINMIQKPFLYEWNRIKKF